MTMIHFSHALLTSFSLQVKSQFTRTYNKEAPCLPYSIESVVRKRLRSVADEAYDESEELNGDSSNEEDISKDPMIKMKKPQTKSLQTEGSKRGGRGRGRAKSQK